MLHPLSLTLLLLLANLIAFAGERTLTIGVVTDGPLAQQPMSVAALEREAANVLAPGLRLAVRPEPYSGDWSARGVDAALEAALNDPRVDVVLAQGILAGQEAARRGVPRKPVIAPLVIDPVMQKFPLANGMSGRHNFAYVADFEPVENTLRTFHDAVGFKHLVALVDETLLHALPELAAKADAVAAALQARVTLLPAGTDVAANLAAIPPDADAVYVAGLMRLSDADMQELARGLIARRLPSYSALGRSGLDNGLLLTTGGAPREFERLARRVVLLIQRIAQGEDPASFEVAFHAERHLAINMATARALDFTPPWQVLADAEELNADAPAAGLPLTLAAALNEALAANPGLAASAARADSHGEDVGIARSSLLPTVDGTLTRTRIDADRASPLTQAENTTSGGYALTQVLYSERAWANYTITKLRYQAALQSHRQDTLDTLESTASAYLDLLRARSAESVRRSNVALTRKNLEIARARESVGLGGRSDFLRWVAQLARDKQDLLGAESTRRQAETQLLRVLHRPADSAASLTAADLDAQLTTVSTPRLQTLLDTPAHWRALSDYAVYTSLAKSPELAQADAQVTANQRSLSAARRAYYIPDFALVANHSNTWAKSGAGSTALPGAPDDRSWNISLQATLPLFDGLRRKAELSQARHELRASEGDRSAASDSVAARTRAALHRIGSSWPAIALSVEAESAASENLANVTDAYARGAVSITELIDAQSTALSSGLAVTDAKYHFMTDLVAVLRSVSEFDLLLDPAAGERWLDRVYAGGASPPASSPVKFEESR